MPEPTRTYNPFVGELPTSAGEVPAYSATVARPSPPGFELGEEVGRGGMGVVYRARDLRLDREVAVKLLQDRFPANSTAASRFVEEARITAQLQHPGIPPLYHVGTAADGRPFLAMKLVQGDTLDALLKRGDPLDRLGVFAGIAQAVGYAHAQGVIHRDLKPANVMVGAFGEVQVMDWGLAKRLSGRASSATVEAAGAPVPGLDTLLAEVGPGVTAVQPAGLPDGDRTRAGSVLGTPAYMPPEQARGEIDRIDARSDVFGLGAVLCVLLTGQPPYNGVDGTSTWELAARADLSDAFVRLADRRADPEVVALCRRCLSAEPDDRPANAVAVAAEVATLRASADERARRAEVEAGQSLVRHAERRRRRRLWIGGLSSVVAVLAISCCWSSYVVLRMTRPADESDFG